jgi:hypothetical protein
MVKGLIQAATKVRSLMMKHDEVVDAITPNLPQDRIMLNDY